MAEPLKNQFGIEIPGRIARMISPVFSGFEQDAFIRDAIEGYEGMNLLQRGRKLAQPCAALNLV